MLVPKDHALGPQTATGLLCWEHWEPNPFNQGAVGFGGSRPAPRPAGPHRVPLSPGLLLLEAGKLSPVVDGDEELPDEQGSEADEQDGARHREQDHQDVRPLRAV